MAPLDLLGYSCVSISLFGIYLNARKDILCWPVWILSNIGWITYSILGHNGPSLVLWIIFLLSNIYGWKQWHNDIKKKESIKHQENLDSLKEIKSTQEALKLVKALKEVSKKGNNKVVTTPKPKIYPAP
jgi:nicotinamide riboside transporter PnuC